MPAVTRMPKIRARKKTQTSVFERLLRIADKGYRVRMQEGLPPSYKEARRHRGGDALADFIVIELEEATRGLPNDVNGAPGHAAIEAMQRAREDLQNVIDAIAAKCDGNGAIRRA